MTTQKEAQRPDTSLGPGGRHSPPPGAASALDKSQEKRLAGRLGAGRGRRSEQEGATEDAIVEWYHPLNRREFEQTRETVRNREARCAAVQAVANSRTRPSDSTTATSGAAAVSSTGTGLQSGETKVPHGGGHPTASTPSAPEPCTCKQSQG